jgi:hypothetical protein
MVHTEKPISFIDKDVDCRERLDQFDPPSDSNGTFRGFWREYKEKLGAPVVSQVPLGFR